jgi:ATP-dependent helicase/nuclease subunit A
LTAQQSRAVFTRDVSVVLSSGAGCGKTYVLTERYLAHLCEGAEVGQVVAITFTERAARQMRARIRRAVVAHLRLAPTEAEAETWARHLRNLESAPIATIHAFCGTILRQHALDAGLDPRFDVLEEVLAVNLEAEASARCLQALLTSQSPAGEDLRYLVLLHGWRTVLDGVSTLLRSFDERAWAAWLARPAAEIAAEQARRAQDSVLPRYLAHVIRSRPALTRCVQLLQRYPPQPGPMSDSVALILRELPLLPHASDLPGAVKALTEAARVGRVGAKAWPDPIVYEQIKEAFEKFREALRGLGVEEFSDPGEALEQEVLAGQRFLRVAGEVMHAYREAKRQHGVVDFQDLLVLTRDLLRDRPEVRARLQDRFRHLLIDELQDTDPVQMELIGYLGGGGMTAGRLFAVGDHKQSIYRFRGADVSLFRDLRRSIPHEGRQDLTINFRSQPAILDFANALLGSALTEYEPLVAHQPQINPGPCVEFLWAPRDEDANVSAGRSTEAEWIARRLAGMIGREAVVVDREEGPGRLRPVRAGDIVLLFRAMSNVHLYEAALRAAGLDYYLVGGRAFFAQQEIYDILNLLRALENPQDAVSLAGVLRSPFCCVSDEGLYVLGRHRSGLWAGLFDESLEANLPAGQREPVRRARRFLGRWRARKDAVPISQLLGEVFADSGYDAATQLEFLGDRKLANLWKLQELARTFDRSGLFGLAEFIARLGDLVRSQPREEQAATLPESADVVRLMTIHQAKGLEFPVVVVPDLAAVVGGAHAPVAQWDPALGCVTRPPADDDPPPFPGFGHRLWRVGNDLEDWHEDLRTLYVACTRPRDYLILSAALPDGYQPAGPWLLTLAERFDLASGICLAPEVPPERVPAVRVYDTRRPPPAPPAASTSSRALDSPPASPLARPAPLPSHFPRPIVSWPELAARLREGDDLFGSLPPEPPGPRSTREAVLRDVLGRWDFRLPDGWRALLRTAGSPAERGEWEGMLARFSASELRRHLASGESWRREIEYVIPPGEPGTPGVAGTLDCLWQTAEGWHLLFYQFDAVSDRERCWKERLPELVLAAEAVRRQSGSWPRSVTLAFLSDATAIRRSGNRLPCREVLGKVAEQLRQAGSP